MHFLQVTFIRNPCEQTQSFLSDVFLFLVWEQSPLFPDMRIKNVTLWMPFPAEIKHLDETICVYLEREKE